MAQYNKVAQDYRNQDRSNFEVMMLSTINGEVVTTSNPLPVLTTNNDAFGRTQVSEPFTLGDYKHLYAVDENFINKIVGTGSSVEFNINKACATLITGIGTTCYTAHQTKIYHHYQPGKSQFILSSINFKDYQTNVTKRTGYFDDKNGIYAEQVGVTTGIGTMNIVLRSYASGSVQERRIPQEQWNKNTLTNVGIGSTNNYYGIEMDITKTQLFWTDFQWLGVGKVRCGFVIDGMRILCHEYSNTNHLDAVYMSNPNLPVRCEVFNTGVGIGGSMDQICATVVSEGGYVESGIDWAIGISTMRSTGSTGGVALPALAIRLKNSFKSQENRAIVRPNMVSVYAETKSVNFNIIKLPNSSYLSTTDVGGLVWTSVNTNSAVEYCTNATSYTNGEILEGGYCSAGASQNAVSTSAVTPGDITKSKKNVITQNFDSTNSEIYLIAIKTIETGNNVTANVSATIQWREIY